MGIARTSYVCPPCRASWKRGFPEPGEAGRTRVCPRCAEPLIHAGSVFAAPARRDDEGWRALTVLLNAGVRFRTSGCDGRGAGYRPRTVREVRERLAYAGRTGTPVAEALVLPELP
ncbi:deoxyxylulose-5-phosphate synthase [Streptomyces sp. MJP52]|uniref:deoxyxylulose-5-phosphate synthase n=1 Tax=Streptomyces sp. MJP52 TaxID=2940555 RepID=UPI00247332A5|nr:deoxyxylulose-5-phosphate synthase [Streptomyces sp. MJP52]